MWEELGRGVRAVHSMIVHGLLVFQHAVLEPPEWLGNNLHDSSEFSPVFIVDKIMSFV